MIFVSCLLLAGCGDPLDRVDKLSDLDMPADAPKVGVLAPEDAPGILTEARAAAAAEAATEGETQLASAAATDTRGGLFGIFRRSGQQPPASDGAETLAGGATGAGDDAAPVVQAAMPAGESPAATAAPQRAGGGGFLGGLFAGGGATGSGSGSGPDAMEVQPGTMLPFGQVAKVCGLSRRELGKEIARQAQFRLHDSVPGSTQPHTFFITGFDDRCARQVTGALGLFGDVAMHEPLRYGPSGTALPWGDTDRAYEKVKRQVCGVGKNKPCGARIGQMQKDTVFLTVYERFGDGSRWSNLLLHDGEVLAQEIEG